MKSKSSINNYWEHNVKTFPPSCAICRHIGYSQYGLYCNIDTFYVQPNGKCNKYDFNELFRRA